MISIRQGQGAIGEDDVLDAAGYLDEADRHVGGVIASWIVNEVEQMVDVINVVAFASNKGVFVLGTCKNRHKRIRRSAFH